MLLVFINFVIHVIFVTLKMYYDCRLEYFTLFKLFSILVNITLCKSRNLVSIINRNINSIQKIVTAVSFRNSRNAPSLVN